MVGCFEVESMAWKTPWVELSLSFISLSYVDRRMENACFSCSGALGSGDGGAAVSEEFTAVSFGSAVQLDSSMVSVLFFMLWQCY